MRNRLYVFEPKRQLVLVVSYKSVYAIPFLVQKFFATKKSEKDEISVFAHNEGCMTVTRDVAY
jgi:hypothetical protein